MLNVIRYQWLHTKNIYFLAHYGSYNYEKLEFLGDRVLGLVIAKKLLASTHTLFLQSESSEQKVAIFLENLYTQLGLFDTYWEFKSATDYA